MTRLSTILLSVSRFYIPVAVLLLVPLYFFGGAFFGQGIGGTLEAIREGISYFDPASWLTFVMPPVLFVTLLVLWRTGKTGKPPALVLLAGTLGLALGAAIIVLRFEDPPWAGDFLRGAYRMEDGRVLVINSSPVAALDFWLSDGTRAMTWTGDQLSYSGTTCIGAGVLPDDFFMATSSPRANAVLIRMRNEPQQRAQRLPLRETALTFVSDGTKLSGRLVEPQAAGPVPLVIFPEGETTVSTLENEYEHHLLAGLGFAAFIYDARGVGESGGRMSKDPERLLGDARAAVDAARAAAADRVNSVGVYGSSFAANVAATANVDFAIIAAPLAVERAGIRKTKATQLYVIPGADKEAPAKPLLDELRALRTLGHPIDIAVYPATEFSMIRSERRRGRSCQAGKAKSYYKLLDHWLRTGMLLRQPDLIALPRKSS